MPERGNRRLLPAVVVAGLLRLASPLEAQEFADFCPGSDMATEAAVVGFVTDPDAGAVVPGVTVAASWVAGGTRHRVEAQTNVDGLYALCGLPPSADVQLRASFGDRRGPAVGYRADEVLAQRDLEIRLAGGSEEEVAIPEGTRSGRIFGASTIREEDLLALPEMTVYELLRQHGRLRFERGTSGEVILYVGRGVTGVPSLSGNSRFRGVEFFIDERREGDGINAIRQMSIDEVRQIDILSPSEASARYGGDGYLGAISIRTKGR